MNKRLNDFTADLGEVRLSFQLLLADWVDKFHLSQNSFRHREVFSKINTCCLFIGHPRSGHSLIGSLIDAHPHAVIGHRADSLRHVEAGMDLRDVFFLMLRNSQRFAKNGRKLTRYQYLVPGQWQSRFSELHVIGDQEGRLTAERLAANPALLERLTNIQGISFKFIHVIRNPFDNISSWASRTKRSLASAAGRYFALCRAVQLTRAQLDAGSLFEIRHEAFLKNPEARLKALCQYLKLETTEDYINACTSITYQQPNRSRYHAGWTEPLIKDVERNLAQFDFLKEYSFNE